MNSEVEKIDSSKMEVLSEFAFEGDVNILEQLRNVSVAYRIGILDDNFIIASQSDSVNNPKINNIPQDATEKFKSVIAEAIKRNWWSGNIAFELENFDAVLNRLEEIYGERPAREIDLNELDIVNGKDKIAVSKMSIMPNNVGQPINSVQLTNYRKVDMDDYVSSGWHLYVTPETGLKLMDEMKSIRPIIEKRLTDKQKKENNYGTFK